MSSIPGTNVPAPIVPFTTDDTYPTHSDQYGQGGWRGVANEAEMNAIPADRRKDGMAVFVKETKLTYYFNSTTSTFALLSNFNNFLSTFIFSTWAELAAYAAANPSVTLLDSFVARVLTGATTHVDPVTGATVVDKGVYRYSASAPIGWKRVGNLEVVDVESLATAAAASATTAGTAATNAGNAAATKVAVVQKQLDTIPATQVKSYSAVSSVTKNTTSGEISFNFYKMSVGRRVGVGLEIAPGEVLRRVGAYVQIAASGVAKVRFRIRQRSTTDAQTNTGPTDATNAPVVDTIDILPADFATYGIVPGASSPVLVNVNLNNAILTVDGMTLFLEVMSLNSSDVEVITGYGRNTTGGTTQDLRGYITPAAGAAWAPAGGTFVFATVWYVGKYADVTAPMESLTAWEVVALTVTNGFWATDGTEYTSGTTYKHALYTLNGTEQSLRATGSLPTGSSSTALAIYFGTAGAVLGTQFVGPGPAEPNAVYTNQLLTLPSGTLAVGLVSYSLLAANTPKLEVLHVAANVATRLVTAETNLSSFQARQNLIGNSRFTGLTWAWLGTSIPAGATPGVGSYPALVASGLLMGAGANEAVGSSMARAGRPGSPDMVNDPLFWKGMGFYNLWWALTHTLAEKNEMITNWAAKYGPGAPFAMGASSGENPPATLSSGQQAAILDCSYETKLVARHLGVNRKDIYVFDHGRNDFGYGSMVGPSASAAGVAIGSLNGTTLTLNSVQSGAFAIGQGLYGIAENTLQTPKILPGTYITGGSGTSWQVNNNHATPTGNMTIYASALATRDRRYYSGAINFLIDLILNDNPKAIIFFVNHYEDDLFIDAITANQALASMWNRPISNYYQRFGCTQRTIQSTGYWQAHSGNPGFYDWIASGGPLTLYTEKQLLLADGTHPFSDFSGNANRKIAALIMQDMLQQIL